MTNNLTFQQALEKCEPGQIINKTDNPGWSEYFIQYGKDKDGEPFWTAGWTTGGPLTESQYPSATVAEEPIWSIYKRGWNFFHKIQEED